jgi:PhoH-like ATPase
MYDKFYLLDTNILLEDASSLFPLSENGKNLIILPETVLDEIDSKKSGFNEINYQAREFARILDDAEVLETAKNESLKMVRVKVHKENLSVIIDIVSKESYECERSSISPKILNDRKILEMASSLKNYYPNEIIFLSQDIMARSRALSLDIKTSGLKGVKNSEFLADFVRKIEIPYSQLEHLDNSDIEGLDPERKAHHFCYECKLIDSDHIVLGTVINNKLSLLDEDELRNQNVVPLNKEQLFFAHAISEIFYNIIIIEALAGSGKTLLALSGAMKLLRKKAYRRIIYIRNSIESLDKGEDIGYLPGMEEKFRIYNHPLMDSLEHIVRHNNKRKKPQNPDAPKEEISAQDVERRIEELIQTYAIETMWVGEMRGRTLSDAVVIIDEAQNISNKTMQMLLSRIDSNSKVIIIGSNKQIDNPYINRHTNALTTLIHATEYTAEEVNLFALKLSKVLRGPITAWAERIFTPTERK